MRTRCPACGATNSLDALLGHGEASKAFVASLNLVGELATPLVKYLGMFRSQNRELTFERTAKLIGEISGDINAQQIKRGHHSYPAPKAAWIWAINTMLERRDQGKLQLPLKNHGYLYEVISSFKPENAPAPTERRAAAAPRAKTEEERAAEQAEHERQKHTRPNLSVTEMLGFTQMNKKQPERGLKNIPKEQLMAHVAQNKQPEESLEQCYQRLKAAEIESEQGATHE
ncbi:MULTISPECIES: hypothetical protein [Acinetobacter calcoaceticus/baumannii complex]|uniref:hypothetical protein n=1 Tax=Acinetobacter calcoaceticus/baumannii complex TaxID=909768 RepID=UPI00049FB8FA|nr:MULTISPECIES: hypothetical protein [Acinetobacter calcoaceticus/baumannii complex]KCX99133.1 hypothetical protein J584_0621 [Acinetobacter sp. 72431]MBQ5174269.1 hypothetical protein [Acinetobacter pittii]MCF1280296.1 DUF2752 domain-containing protein [Acinetobacter pittii]MCU4544473.1 DUF2752 domain-containing protein [Acinetobacter pittii]OTT09816.1 hypothetical protein CAT55_06830 [Acinetobacter pittii]